MVTARVRVTTTITVWDRVRLSVALRNRARGLLQGSGLGGKGVEYSWRRFLVAVGASGCVYLWWWVHSCMGCKAVGVLIPRGLLVTVGVLMKMGDRCMYALR